VKTCGFTYHRPETIESAVALLAALAPVGGRILAGGQSLVPMMAYRMAQPAHLIDITRIAGLEGVSAGAGFLRVGAATRHAALARPVCGGALGAMLPVIAGHIAHAPIRNRGTFGGSLANADPASEWCTLLATLAGSVEVTGRDGTREIRAADFFRGVMTTQLRDDELLTAAHLPILQGYRWGFYEINRRAGDYAMAMCLVAYQLRDGVMADVHLGIGGAEAWPRRLGQVEGLLTGQPACGPVFARAAEAAAATLDPMTDHNMTAAFRRHLLRTAVTRALAGSLA
jgi:carbon-monoxide dehydrogenase medium subunit